jgi:signal peptidase I
MLVASEELHKNDAVFKRAANVDFFLNLLLYVALALVIRVFLFGPVLVDGDSMYPTLLDGERMFSEKVTYLVQAPERGDIIICRYPAYSVNCVKRVVALPGETVAVQDGKVYVDGKPLNESKYWSDEIWRDMQPVTVPAHNVFVMGDNRNHSTDSREPSVGSIPYNQIKGKVHSVIWPLTELRSVYTGVSPMAGVPYDAPRVFSWGA